MFTEFPNSTWQEKQAPPSTSQLFGFYIIPGASIREGERGWMEEGREERTKKGRRERERWMDEWVGREMGGYTDGWI